MPDPLNKPTWLRPILAWAFFSLGLGTAGAVLWLHNWHYQRADSNFAVLCHACASALAGVGVVAWAFGGFRAVPLVGILAVVLLALRLDIGQILIICGWFCCGISAQLFLSIRSLLLGLGLGLAGIGAYAALVAEDPSMPLGHPNYIVFTTTLLAAFILDRATRDQHVHKLSAVLGVAVLGLGALQAIWFSVGQFFLGAVVIATLITWRLRVYPWMSRRWHIVLMTGVCLGSIGLFFALWDQFHASLRPRWSIWQLAWEGFYYNPWQGLGQWGMHFATPIDPVSRATRWAQADGFSDAGNAHNIILHMLLSSGLQGFIALLVLAVAIIVYWRRGGVPLALTPLAVFIAIGLVAIAPWTVAGLCLFGLAVAVTWPMRHPSLNMRWRLGFGVPMTAALLGGLCYWGIQRSLDHMAALADPVVNVESIPWLMWNDESQTHLLNRWNNHARETKSWQELAAVYDYGARQL